MHVRPDVKLRKSSREKTGSDDDDDDEGVKASGENGADRRMCVRANDEQEDEAAQPQRRLQPQVKRRGSLKTSRTQKVIRLRGMKPLAAHLRPRLSRPRRLRILSQNATGQESSQPFTHRHTNTKAVGDVLSKQAVCDG